MNLTDRLRERLSKESDEPWKVPFIRACIVIAAADIARFLPGCSVTRTVAPMSPAVSGPR